MTKAFAERKPVLNGKQPVGEKIVATYTNEAGKTFPVHPKGNRFFYWSPRALRLLPVAKSKVSF